KYLTAGTYYVRVRCYAQEFSSVAGAAAGEYTLYSQFDDHGNSRNTATSINPNSETEGHFERAGDEDFFKIVISHSATLTLKTTGSTDTVGTLLDVSGNEIAQNDNANGSLGSNFRISRSVTAGIYYVKVKHRNRAATGEYTLVSSLDDDHGNSRSTATLISPNSITPGRIERAGDIDFFKIVISYAERLTIKTTGSTDTEGFLYHENSTTPISSDDDSGSGRNFKISQWLGAGIYYVKVNSNRTTTGSYTLVLNLDDDHGDTISRATSITPDSTTAGRIDRPGDVDYFKIVFPENGRLDVKTTGSGDTIGELLDANGNKLVSSSGADHNFIITRNVMAGTYYVKVKHHSSTAISNYSLVSKFRPGVSTE
ncbi:MAG: pre-peptidase C-terminal domain-containing protein, partial [Sulfurovum sp.]|nr:pre-peptidase C-terminal domain-containing protein [Sulfurovum sp.]